MTMGILTRFKLKETIPFFLKKGTQKGEVLGHAEESAVPKKEQQRSFFSGILNLCIFTSQTRMALGAAVCPSAFGPMEVESTTKDKGALLPGQFFSFITKVPKTFSIEFRGQNSVA